MYSLSANPELLRTTVSAAATGSAAEKTAVLQGEVLALFDALRDRLLRYAVSFSLPVQDAEDILQEAFLALFRHLERGRPRGNLHGWLYRTTHNLALKRRAALHMEWRRRESAGDRAGAEHDPLACCADSAPGMDEQLVFCERQQRLRAVLNALPENDQACLRLRADGLRYREIAAIVGISLGSVAISLARSFERLQRMESR